MKPRRSRVGRLLALAGLALALAIAFAWLPRAIVAASLALDAESQAQRVARWGTPFTWNFDAAGADPAWVARGSSGIAAATVGDDGTRFAFDGRALDLSLDLEGRRLRWDQLARAELEASATSPLAIRLLGDDAGALPFTPYLEAVLPAGGRHLVADIRVAAQGSAASSARLRLRAESSTDGAVLAVRRLRLLPAGEPCGEAAPAPCPVRRAAIEGATPEALLAARDRALAEQPLAVPTPSRVDSAALTLTRLAASGPLGLLPSALAVLALLALLASRLRGPAAAVAAAAWSRAFAVAGALALLLLSLPFDGRAAFVLLACVAVAILAPRRPDRPRRRGIGPVLVAALAGLALLGMMALAGGLAGQPPAWRWPTAPEALRYLLWSLLQLLLLRGLLLPLAQRATSGPAMAVLATGLLFGLLHLPNLGLMLLTTLAGAIWATLSLRGASLPVLALAHATLGLAALALVPPAWLRSAEVGARFAGVLP